MRMTRAAYSSQLGKCSAAILVMQWGKYSSAAPSVTSPPMMWATAQALVTLPVSLVGYIVACGWLQGQHSDFPLPFGPRPAVFIVLMLAIAVLCSWVGALCWNIASQRLPTVILGPLIVFETLAGLLYTFLLRQSLPPLLTLSGILLLVLGVVSSVRARPEKPVLQELRVEPKK